MKKNIFIIFLLQVFLTEYTQSLNYQTKLSPYQIKQLVKQSGKTGLTGYKQEKNILNNQLSTSVKQGYLKEAKELLEKGADPNFQGYDEKKQTPLMIAVNIPNKNMIELLLKYEANPNIKNNQGKTAYELVMEFLEFAKKHHSTFIKPYEEIANLLKEWEEKYKKDYKEYLNKWRRTSAAILTTSILPLLQKLVNEGRMTQEEFNEIKKGLRPIPQDVVKLIHKQSEPTFNEWFNKFRIN